MEYLSKKYFVHSHLVPRNILVTEQGICKVFIVVNTHRVDILIYVQIADFAMSRHLLDENYYISHAKKIPIKWTASEVSTLLMLFISYIINCITKGLHFK